MAVNDGPILVTGGAGFIGARTVAALLERGHEVAVIDNLSVGCRERLAEVDPGSQVRFDEVDLRDRVALAAVVADVRPSAVIHLAAIHFIPYCVEHPEEVITSNILGTQNLIDALGCLGDARVVFASTADVYEPSLTAHHEDDPIRPFNVYGASKIAGEWLLAFRAKQRAALDVRVARLFNVYGPGDANAHVLPAILEQMRGSDAISLGDTTPRRDYNFVDDVAVTLCDLMEWGGGPVTVNIGSGTSTSVSEIVTAIGQITGRTLTIARDPDRLRPIDRPELLADTATLRALLPNRHVTSIVDGLRRTLEHVGLVGVADVVA